MEETVLPSHVLQKILVRLPLVSVAQLAWTCKKWSKSVLQVHTTRMQGVHDALMAYLESDAFANHPMQLCIHVSSAITKRHMTMLAMSKGGGGGAGDSITFIHGEDAKTPPGLRIEYTYNSDRQRDDFLRQGIRALMDHVDESTIDNHVPRLDDTRALEAVHRELDPVIRRLKTFFH